MLTSIVREAGPHIPSVIVVSVLTRIIHEHFCCNRRSAALVREASCVKREAQDGMTVSDRRMEQRDRHRRRWRSQSPGLHEASFVSRFERFTFHERLRLAIRWPRVYSDSDGHLDPRDPLHVGA